MSSAATPVRRRCVARTSASRFSPRSSMAIRRPIQAAGWPIGARARSRIAEHGLDQEREQRERGASWLSPSMLAPLAHGGDLCRRARDCFPARRNLSSTSRPGSIQIPIRSRSSRPICSRNCLSPRGSRGLPAIAAEAYGAPSAAHVVVAPGSQIVVAQAVGARGARPRRGAWPDLCRACAAGAARRPSR